MSLAKGWIRLSWSPDSNPAGTAHVVMWPVEKTISDTIEEASKRLIEDMAVDFAIREAKCHADSGS